MLKQLFPLKDVVGSATYYGDPIQANGFTGARFYITITESTTLTSLTVSIQALNPISAQWVDVPGAAYAALSTSTTKTLTVYPGIAETTNESVSDTIGGVIRGKAVLVAASCTFNLCADLMR